LRGRLSIVLAILGLAMVAAPAAADKRVALVIGNSAYQNVARLENPVNDARLMADTLRGLGFTLVGGGAQLNLDKAGFDNAVQSFGNQVVGADVGLFYYAGHGVQVRNSNYLVPVTANPTREADVFVQMVDVALVLSQMEGSGTKLNLVVLDACRNNPFGGRGLRATNSGLAQISAPEGTLISYATQPGNVAKDGADGNSPYTKALAQTIQHAGLDIFQTFNEVGLAVKRATGGEQQPWVSSSPIDGSFYFGGAPQPAAPAGDEIAWGFFKSTTDTGALRQFVTEFPGSRHRNEAETRIAALEREAAAHAAAADEQRRRAEADARHAQDTAVVQPAPPSADEAAWSALKSTTDADALRRFVMEFPDSRHWKEAETQIAAFERDAAARRRAEADARHAQDAAVAPTVQPSADETVWSALKSTTDMAALRQFVLEYPGSRHRDEAKDRIEQFAAMQRLQTSLEADKAEAERLKAAAEARHKAMTEAASKLRQ
jgi:uncharacterized caspase-like protein